MQGRLDPWSLHVSKQSPSKFGGISLAENLTPHILSHQVYNHSIAWFIKAENQQSISPLTLYRVPQRNSSLHRQHLPTTLSYPAALGRNSAGSIGDIASASPGIPGWGRKVSQTAKLCGNIMTDIKKYML